MDSKHHSRSRSTCQLGRKCVLIRSFLERRPYPRQVQSSCYPSGHANTRALPNQYCLPPRRRRTGQAEAGKPGEPTGPCRILSRPFRRLPFPQAAASAMLAEHDFGQDETRDSISDVVSSLRFAPESASISRYSPIRASHYRQPSSRCGLGLHSSGWHCSSLRRQDR